MRAWGARPSRDGEAGPENSGEGSSSYELVIKNTFLTVVDAPAAASGTGPGLSHSRSDSSLSAKTSLTYGAEGLNDSSASRSDNSFDVASSAMQRNRVADREDGKDEEEEEENEPEDGAQPEGLTSRGSALHSLGKCKPCRYFLNGKDRCLLGAECSYCHAWHKKKRARRGGKTRGGGAEGSVDDSSTAGASSSKRMSPNPFLEPDSRSGGGGQQGRSGKQIMSL